MASVRCPDCGGETVKAGFQVSGKKRRRRQMYACLQCRRRTVNPRRGK